jgi:SAM-dependent methyltransferase/methyltransferase-like protein
LLGSCSVAMSSTYDELPYDDHVFAYTQPANLAAVASLNGLDPPPLDRCRVLDIGCATGSNLLPMAIARPGAGFVGIDLSPRQIDTGRATVARLGLTNVALHVCNLLESTDDLGTFDYIVCHGVYSWVPPAVQDRILDLIRRQLAANGLAYVSYNTYPGWHLRGLARDVLAYHAAGASGGPAERIADARACLDFLVRALPQKDTPYEAVLRREAEHIRPLADSYVYHEYMEADNRPVYFHQFATHAAAHGLQFVAEAAPQRLPGTLQAGVVEALAAAAGDRLRLEQYFDFVRCRYFRRSLLAHAAARPTEDGAVNRIPAFSFTTSAKPEAIAPDPDQVTREQFTVADIAHFETADPLLRSVLWRLWEARPAAVPFADLVDARGPRGADSARELADALLQLYLADIVGLHLHPPALAKVAGPRPCASPFARCQAERGDRQIFNLCHARVDPKPFARYLLPLLDGTRGRDDLTKTLAARSEAGEFAVHDNEGRAVTEPALVRQILTAWSEQALDQLARTGLLTA